MGPLLVWAGEPGHLRPASCLGHARARTDPCADPCAPAQWTGATTRKNYYAKYSTRLLLFFNLFINIAILPIVIGMSNTSPNMKTKDQGGLYFTR